MKRRTFVTTLAAALASVRAFGLTRSKHSLADAWSAWENGEIAVARDQAAEALAAGNATDEARHLLFLTRYVEGGYEDALAHFAAISTGYSDRKSLAETVVDAYIHLDRIADAAAFARVAKGLDKTALAILEMHAARPFATTLSDLSTVPFADHPLTPYFPAFNASINGKTEVVHVDTGGAFIYMGPDRARKLGIETIDAGKGRYHLNLSNLSQGAGIVDNFTLGNAVMWNVPVTVIPTLVGDSDYIIFGTNILERFLSTLDYPGQRLVLSPRADGAAADRHRAMLPPNRANVPFYLWSHHFMFARGGFGEHRDLNFFVDSGLVVVEQNANGVPRQAAFTTSRRKFESWGVATSKARKERFTVDAAIALGPLEQSGHLVVAGDAGDTDFGGVRIDGLISHAWLSRYAFTIDFDAREYTFSSAAPLGQS